MDLGAQQLDVPASASTMPSPGSDEALPTDAAVNTVGVGADAYVQMRGAEVDAADAEVFESLLNEVGSPLTSERSHITSPGRKAFAHLCLEGMLEDCVRS